jgi:hypothetical protein
MSSDFNLDLSKSDFKEIFGHGISGELGKRVETNIERDEAILLQLPPKWGRLFPSIFSPALNKDKLKRHFNLVGMGVEALRIYFLVLFLAESDNINLATNLLRSFFDALAYGALLDRAHGGKDVDLGNMKSFDILVRAEHEKVEVEMQRELERKGKTGRPQAFHHFANRLRTQEIDPELIALINEGVRLYNEVLSPSIHEEVTTTDAYALRQGASWLLQSGTELKERAASDIGEARNLFVKFVSGSLRSELIERGEMPQVLDERRKAFLFDSFLKATDFAVYIIEKELQRVIDSSR